ITHKTGIPHSPTGQAIVERAHQSIKKMLLKQKGTNKFEPPAVTLAKALFTLNFLNRAQGEEDPPIVKHFASTESRKVEEKPPVMIRDPESQSVEGPYPLI
ncbi:IGEB protein, partial [Picathartes gymnocephalus]|nr:IGEB protein [Picathartes gymnocephalus]